jgi:hypothetical protein
VTLLYGRVTISVTTAVAVLVVVPLVLLLPVSRGLSAYFVGILAGINAYNWHTAPHSKLLNVPLLKLGTFTVLLVLARGVVAYVPDAGRVLQTGVPQQFTSTMLLGGLLVTTVCFLAVERLTVTRPSRTAVFEASILSGDDR